MKILYITKLTDSNSNGKNIAVQQLLNSISNYADVYWLDLSMHDFKLNDKIHNVGTENYLNSKPDIAVFEEIFCIEIVSIAKKLKKNGIPYIITPHGSLNRRALSKKRFKKFIAMNTILYGFLHNSVGLQFLTEGEMTRSRHYNESYIVPNGITDNDIHRVRTNTREFVYIGRKDAYHKGLDLLIQACANVKRELTENDCRITMYGPTTKDDRLIDELIAKNKLGGIVQNNGGIFGEDKIQTLLRADVFIQTSRFEGLPMSILEALSYGLPVLVTEGTNVAGIVQNAAAGWTCQTNIESIAETLKAAIDDNEISILSKNAVRLGKMYSWDNVSRQTIVLYNKVIKAHASH